MNKLGAAMLFSGDHQALAPGAQQAGLSNKSLTAELRITVYFLAGAPSIIFTLHKLDHRQIHLDNFFSLGVGVFR